MLADGALRAVAMLRAVPDPETEVYGRSANGRG